MAEQFFSEIGEYTPDNLIAGHEIPVFKKGITIEAGQGILSIGSVLGVKTDDLKGKLVDSSNSDGSQIAKYILPEEVDTTDEDVLVVCYKSGVYNRSALVFGGTDTSETHEDTLRKYNIILKDMV